MGNSEVRTTGSARAKEDTVPSQKTDLQTLYRGHEESQSVPMVPSQCEPDQGRSQRPQQADSTNQTQELHLAFFLSPFFCFLSPPSSIKAVSIFWAEWPERLLDHSQLRLPYSSGGVETPGRRCWESSRRWAGETGAWNVSERLAPRMDGRPELKMVRELVPGWEWGLAPRSIVGLSGPVAGLGVGVVLLLPGD